jgi:hypothetical protein
MKFSTSPTLLAIADVGRVTICFQRTLFLKLSKISQMRAVAMFNYALNRPGFSGDSVI